jgi:hypothetical protein
MKSSETAHIESEFPREIEPHRDLWAGIEKAITAEPQHSAKSWSVNGRIFAASAASVFIAVVAIQFMPGQNSQDNASQAGISALVNTYEVQKGLLLTHYKDQPAVTTNWQQQLSDLEAASSTLRASLEKSPDNAVLIRIIGKLYQHQLDLINKVHSPKWQKI